METNFKKKILTLGLICLVLLGMVLSLSFLGQRKSTQKGAFGTGATLRLVETGTSHILNEDTIVEVRMDTTEKITIYRLAMTYDKTKLAIVPMAGDKFEPGPKFGFLNEMTDDLNGNLTLRSGVPIPSSGANPADLPTGQNVLLARFKVKGLVAGTTTISFKDLTTIVNGFNPGSADVAITISTKTPLDLKFDTARVDIGTVNVSLDPATATKPVNQNFDVNIKVDAGTNKINFMKLGLNFDKNKMQIVRFKPNDVVFTPDLFDDSTQDLGSSAGLAKLFAASAKSTLPTGVFTAGTVILKGIANGNAALTIYKEGSEFGGEKGTEEGTFGVDQTVNGAYTIGAGGTGAVNINFKIKFNGVNVKSPDQKVTVRVLKGSLDQEIPNVNVTSDVNGIYSGTVNFDVPAGSGYAVFIKGPKHLARKFCTDNQERFCARPGTLTLIAGTNTFDFSKLLLEPGDLPNPNNANKQDGVANSIDISLAEARSPSAPLNDAASLNVADVNFDGTVNRGDISLILNTIETRYEDDY